MLLKNTQDLSDPATSYRQQILRRLLENKQGMPINELSRHLNISRTAVQNHFSVLEKQGLIKKQDHSKTLGRPSANYVLTDKGIDHFPKRYSLFSIALLQALKTEMDSAQISLFMQNLGKKLAEQYRPRFAGLDATESLQTLLDVTRELGFYTNIQHDSASKTIELNAHNCIYHEVAQQFQEICLFDSALIAALSRKPVELSSCMTKGAAVCSFRMLQESATEGG